MSKVYYVLQAKDGWGIKIGFNASWYRRGLSREEAVELAQNLAAKRNARWFVVDPNETKDENRRKQ
jgi:hypothetical protein